MKWFKHSGTASRDARIAKLMTEYGIEGYGLYFYCLELIASKTDSDDLTFELEHDAPIIAAWTKMDTILVEKIMHRCIELGLFDISDNGHIRCFKLVKWIDRKLVGESTYKEMILIADGESGIIPDNPRVIGENPLLQEENRQEENRQERASQEEGGEDLPEEAVRLSSLLLSLHQETDPGFRATPAQLATWARDIGRLNRLDSRAWPDIETVLRWAKTPGSFWAPNIISGAKLRKQYSTLLGQMRRGQQARVPKPGPMLEMGA